MAFTQFSRKSLFANDNLDGIDFPTDVSSYLGTITADLSGYSKASILPASLLTGPFTRPLQPLTPGVIGSSASITADLRSTPSQGVKSTFTSDTGTMGSAGEQTLSSGSEMSNGLTLPFLPLSTSASLSSASVAAAPTRAALKYLKITDIIPPGNSEAQNSEPSLAVNPLDPRQIIAGTFGTNGINLANPYFKSTDGGNTWNNYGTIVHTDKSIAWLQDGSAALTATLVPNTTEIVTYSGTIDGNGARSAVDTHGSVQPRLCWLQRLVFCGE